MIVSRLMIAVALSMAILLAACGSTATSPTPTATPQRPAAAATPTTAAPQPTASSALTGEQLVNTRCTVCHSTDRIKAAKKTPAEWRATVQRMVGNGAQLTPAEQEIVIKYLSDTYK